MIAFAFSLTLLQAPHFIVQWMRSGQFPEKDTMAGTNNSNASRYLREQGVDATRAPLHDVAHASHADTPRYTSSSAPYQRPRQHVTQEPIQDDQVHVDVPSGRKHMGVATSDPQYLPRTRPTHPAHPRQQRTEWPDGQPQHAPLHYERYLQTPKPGKAIFTARQARARRHVAHIVLLVALLVIVAVVVWFFILR